MGGAGRNHNVRMRRPQAFRCDIMCGIFACLCNTTGRDGKGFIKVINTETISTPFFYYTIGGGAGKTPKAGPRLAARGVSSGGWRWAPVGAPGNSPQDERRAHPIAPG